LDKTRPYSNNGVVLTGGEPLLYPQFDELLKYLAQHGQFVALETNGILLTDSHFALLSQGGSHIAITLESLQSNVHDRIRGQHGAWLAAIRSLDRAKAFGAIRTQITFNLTPESKGELRGVCDLGRDLGVNRIKLNPVYRLGPRGKSKKSLYLSLDDLLQLASEWGEQTVGKYSFHVDLALPPALLPAKFRYEARQCSGCSLGGILGVLYDGAIRPCHDFIFDGTQSLLGSIYENYNVEDLLDRLNKLPGASFLDIGGICSKCALVVHCKGFCRAQAKSDYGSTDKPSRLCSELYDQGRFPAELIAPDILYPK